ncbi:hypothetical protein OGH69_15405 [Flavobacterium sp. MFBS3-15]|uniref:hypothetical protein n=1 Tax=Flavobacterium sp. MFBS3-15 TaxID=2989816 RepID=UPI0022359726|nr:hypothetical protein [Flavobacterium sp. MFBS3-15]MCW4470360.1 hypothetical protein [Flavobacterium sp. MFBS3-15]
MKTVIKGSLAMIMLYAFTSCSGDDSKSTNNVQCDCHYTLVEGGQPQEGWTQASDTTDCELDGIKVYYADYNNGQPNDTYYRVLHCK